MRVAYVLTYNLSRADGVVKKIFNQARAWSHNGVEVAIFCMTPNVIDVDSSGVELKQYPMSGLEQRIFVNKKLLADVANFNPTLVYNRYEFWDATIAYLAKKYPVIGELNTNDLAEYRTKLAREKTLKSFLRYMFIKLFRGAALSSRRALIGVTKEIAELPSYTKYCQNTTYVSNSIDVSLCPNMKVPPDGRVKLFFIGSPNQSWHGVDIIESWATQLPQYDFHIVGSEGKGAKNLFFHGFLSPAEYLPILAGCHVCIGSLALFRAGLQEASPLKVREYIASGYPVIIGYDDTAFLDREYPSWLFRYHTKSGIEALVEFIEANKNYCLSDTDAEVVSSLEVEKKRVNFFKGVVGEV